MHTIVSVVTLPNGTQVLGTLFDSSPMIAPPGMTMGQVPEVNLQGISELGGAMMPLPGMDTFNYTFNNPGTYLYYCKYHSAVENGNIAGMVGEVIVLPNYQTGTNLSSLSAQIDTLSGQVGTATTLGLAGVVLGLIGVGVAVWATRKGTTTK